MSKYSASIFNYLFTSINAIVMIINGIIMVPMYFKFMTVSTYGVWLATGNVVGVFGLLEFGLASVITQKMSVALTQNDRVEFKQLASANIFTAVIISLSVFILGMTISPFVAGWVQAEASIKEAITTAYIIALSSAAITILVSLFGAFPQVWQETKTIGIINTIVNLIGVASLVIYLYCGFGVVSLALGYITRAFLNLIGQGIWILVKWNNYKLGKPEFNLNRILFLLKESLYPFLSKISNVLMGSSQSFIIAFFINPTMAAVYDITSKIVVVASNFVNMANGSFFALLSLTFASHNKKEINVMIKNISTFFMTFLITVILYSYCFTKPIIHYWVGLDKYGGDTLMILIVIAVFVMQSKNYFNNLLYTGGLIKISAKLDVLSTALYLILLFSLVNALNIYAIPIASISTGFLFMGLYIRLLFLRLHVNIRLIIKVVLKLIATALPFVLIHWLLEVNLMNFYIFILYGLMFTFLYVLVTFFLHKPYIRVIYSKLR